MAQTPERHGNRLRPSKQERSLGQEEQGRNQDRSEKIHMLQRIKCDAAQTIGRVVPKLPGGIGVCRFMESNREEDWDEVVW